MPHYRPTFHPCERDGGEREVQMLVRLLELGEEQMEGALSPLVRHALIAVTKTAVNFGRRLLCQHSECQDRLFATRDHLTDTLNRRGIAARWSHRRMESGLALLLVDLDHFKAINDAYGHNVGDDVLKGVVRIIGNAVRRDDEIEKGPDIGRHGGEEFLVMLSGADEVGALATAERIRRSVETTPIVSHAGQSIRVTVSIGVSLVPQDRDFDRAFAQADVAMYRAKDEGRNRVMLFRSGMEKKNHEPLLLRVQQQQVQKRERSVLCRKRR